MKPVAEAGPQDRRCDPGHPVEHIVRAALAELGVHPVRCAPPRSDQSPPRPVRVLVSDNTIRVHAGVPPGTDRSVAVLAIRRALDRTWPGSSCDVTVEITRPADPFTVNGQRPDTRPPRPPR